MYIGMKKERKFQIKKKKINWLIFVVFVLDNLYLCCLLLYAHNTINILVFSYVEY